jgi:ABC-type Fe3+ transport system substrate-binding protein
MKALSLWSSVFLLLSLIQAAGAFAAPAPSAALLKAKLEAEAKGYMFFTDHEEIVANAKKEGKLKVLSSQDDSSLKAISEAFKKKYPFIDVSWEEVSGTEVYQRMIAEMKAGVAKWDVNYSAPDYYLEYLAHQKKVDLLGMAKHGVLKLAPDMVDPVHRNIVSLQSNAQVVVYNNSLISADKVPNTWEDFLKPEFQGRKFAVDVRPKVFAALVPAWGLEKVLSLAKKIGAQKPIWMRGDARMITALQAGEFPIVMGPNYKTFVRAQEKDPNKVLAHRALEPIPIRLSETEGLLDRAENFHAGLLWLEFVAGPEGQKILDDVDLSASLFTPGSAHQKLTEGKKVSVVAWEHYLRMGSYEKDIVKAFGFPRPEKR